MLKSNTKCFVNEHGQIVNVLELYSGSYEDGSVDALGHTVQSWDESLNVSSAHEASQNYYWDGSSWQSRTPSPSQYHVWQNAAWSLDSDRFTGEVRRQRDAKLTASDWTQTVSDSPLDSDQIEAWATYRQELRDITNNLDGITNLDDVIWPTKPE
jgi:hypothetical protein